MIALPKIALVLIIYAYKCRIFCFAFEKTWITQRFFVVCTILCIGRFACQAEVAPQRRESLDLGHEGPKTKHHLAFMTPTSTASHRLPSTAIMAGLSRQTLLKWLLSRKYVGLPEESQQDFIPSRYIFHWNGDDSGL